MKCCVNILAAALCGILLLASVSCGKDGLASAPSIDSKLAFSMTESVFRFGPRLPDTPSSKALVNFIAEKAKAFGASVKIIEFTAMTPEGIKTFRNVEAFVEGKDKSRFVIVGTHFDTKKLMTVPDFAGANDGSSGTGLQLAMIKAAVASRPPYSVRFVFFDGEECFNSYTATDGLYGSRKYAADLEKSGELKKCLAFILTDMIGDADLCVTLPADTPTSMQSLIMKIAAAQNVSEYITASPTSVIDDHVPFMEKGIPSVDFIDFSYGPRNSYWHTKEDTMDKISEKSLEILGNIVLSLVWNIDKLKD